MQRIINIEVAGNRARASARELGTQGEVAAVTVALVFDESWDGLAKRLLWRSASGSATGYTLLDSPDADGVYSVAVPALPLSEAGVATLTVEGVVTSGDEVERRARSVLLRFRVEPNDLNSDSPAQAIDATVAEQLASALGGKASVSHTHTKSDIADFSHTHVKANISDFSHTHPKSDITNFSHTHVKANISDFSHTHPKSDIVNFSHTHTKSEITDFEHTHEVDADAVNYNEDGVDISVATALDSLFELADEPALREYTVSFAAANWSGASAPYTQSVTCSAVNSGTRAVVSVADSATAAQYEAACEACLRFAFGYRSVTATAYGTKPSAALPIKIGVIK